MDKGVGDEADVGFLFSMPAPDGGLLGPWEDMPLGRCPTVALATRVVQCLPPVRMYRSLVLSDRYCRLLAKLENVHLAEVRRGGRF